jgi:multiple sugar transport system ATP-binding protein
MAGLAFEGVSKVFPDGTTAVHDLDLEVGDGELMILVGPSGSGKSTALRMLAGLEEASSGTIRIGGRVVNDVAPKDRDIAMVFQSYALYPHMDVAHNMGFALRMQRVDKASIGERVGAAAPTRSAMAVRWTCCMRSAKPMLWATSMCGYSA